MSYYLSLSFAGRCRAGHLWFRIPPTALLPPAYYIIHMGFTIMRAYGCGCSPKRVDAPPKCWVAQRKVSVRLFTLTKSWVRHSRSHERDSVTRRFTQGAFPLQSQGRPHGRSAIAETQRRRQHQRSQYNCGDTLEAIGTLHGVVSKVRASPAIAAVGGKAHARSASILPRCGMVVAEVVSNTKQCVHPIRSARG